MLLLSIIAVQGSSIHARAAEVLDMGKNSALWAPASSEGVRQVEHRTEARS